MKIYYRIKIVQSIFSNLKRCNSAHRTSFTTYAVVFMCDLSIEEENQQTLIANLFSSNEIFIRDSANTQTEGDIQQGKLPVLER